ncbi:MAG: hypothetical protein AAFR41_07355 [Pseudomonadota bacterium]
MTAPDILDKGLEAALRLAQTQPWNSLSLRTIADEAGLPLSDFHGVADRDRLALHADAYFDSAMSSEGIDPDDHPRERLFDVVMLRFEAMEPHREGLLSLYRSMDRAASLRLQRLKARRQSAEWAFISAGLDTKGPMPLRLRAIGLAWVLARTEEAWRRETDPGYAKTMSALDKGLRQAESQLKRMGAFRFGGSKSRAAGATSTSPDDAPETPASDAAFGSVETPAGA